MIPDCCSGMLTTRWESTISWAQRFLSPTPSLLKACEAHNVQGDPWIFARYCTSHAKGRRWSASIFLSFFQCLICKASKGVQEHSSLVTVSEITGASVTGRQFQKADHNIAYLTLWYSQQEMPAVKPLKVKKECRTIRSWEFLSDSICNAACFDLTNHFHNAVGSRSIAD